MEKRKCRICNKKLNYSQKNYCSEQCQYKGYRCEKLPRVITKCLSCKCDIITTENRLKRGVDKYCSKKCYGKFLAIKYLGKNNPMFGKESSDENKKKLSDRSKKMWKDEKYRKFMNEMRIKYFEKHGYYLGCDEDSINKRKDTMMKKYGIPHNWSGKYGDRTCDKTTIDKYGKDPVEMLMDHRFYYGEKTSIEKHFEEILKKLKINYKDKFRIKIKDSGNRRYREYDFLIPKKNIIFEIDGDYWHGNKKKFKKLNKIQKDSIKNDKFKTILAENNGYKIYRFWGSELKNEEQIKNKILKYVK